MKSQIIKMIRGHNQGMAKEGHSENWGGARPGAGRPRTETLDAVECWFLADLLEKHQEHDKEDYSATITKLRRMADRIAAGR